MYFSGRQTPFSRTVSFFRKSADFRKKCVTPQKGSPKACLEGSAGERDRCLARGQGMLGGRGRPRGGVIVCCQRVLPLSPRPPYPTWVSREVQHHTMLRHDVVRK